MKRKADPESHPVTDKDDGPSSLRSASAAAARPARTRRRTRTGRHTGGSRGWGSRVSLRPAPTPTAPTADSLEALRVGDRTVLDRANLFTEATRVPDTAGYQALVTRTPTLTPVTRLVPREAPSFGLPTRISRYEVLGRIATGGMAEILLGRLRGPRGFERTVVIKRILPHLARLPAFVEMFLDEARLASRIRHSNVVQVHELCQEDDDLYLVMEYLEGGTSGELLERLGASHQRLEPLLAAHIVAEACAGLHAAHELTDEDGRALRLVHRDVSPQNLFITLAGEIKVIDFGIATAVDRDSRTEIGLTKGKHAYMSPEQCKGEVVDRRCDVFALGIVLYELATGRRLFSRDNQLSTIKAICEEPIVPPSLLAPQIPSWLEKTCLRALARRPADRFASADEMRQCLREGLRRPGADGPAERLARLAMVVFPDRIRGGRQVDWQTPRAGARSRKPRESTSGLDIPITMGPAVIDERPRAPLPTVPRAVRPRPTWYRPALAGAMLGALSLLVLSGSKSPEPKTRTTARRIERAPRAAPPSLPVPVVSEVPAPEQVLIQVDTFPHGATVLVDGRTSGITPLDLRLPRSTDPVSFKLERAGYESIRLRLIPDTTRTLRRRLVWRRG